jgi:hypothetical protein
MAEASRSLILGFVLIPIFLSPLHAQVTNPAPADPNSALATPTPTQAPDDMTKKITELVHAGKYAEAQQLTAGLLIAYPNDQRLIKAKALIEKLLAPAGSASTPPADNHPTHSLASAQPTAAHLAGMDQVDYDALLELARHAQQNTDLEQQKASLKQFMDQSATFLQKHPDEMLLWQLRAASAISLDASRAGYEAGQRLLAIDGSDQNVRLLLAQLKNKGWLDKQQAENARYDWILGTMLTHYSHFDKHEHLLASGESALLELTRSDAIIEARGFYSDGTRPTESTLRAIILDSGGIRCELKDHPVLSCEIDSVQRTMKVVFPTDKRNKGNTTVWELRK